MPVLASFLSPSHPVNSVKAVPGDGGRAGCSPFAPPHSPGFSPSCCAAEKLTITTCIRRFSWPLTFGQILPMGEKDWGGVGGGWWWWYRHLKREVCFPSSAPYQVIPNVLLNPSTQSHRLGLWLSPEVNYSNPWTLGKVEKTIVPPPTPHCGHHWLKYGSIIVLIPPKPLEIPESFITFVSVTTFGCSLPSCWG